MHLKNLVFLLLIILFSSISSAKGEELIVTESSASELKYLLKEKKFVEDFKYMYPGAPDELTRAGAEKVIDDLILRLILGINSNPSKEYVLSQFKISLGELTNYDSEEADRSLLYLENIMDILGIDSSDGLLNNWRYGFNPQ